MITLEKPPTLRKERMTVDKLIEQLGQLPGQLPVLVEGYESGWDGLHQLRTEGVVFDEKAQEWNGQYRLAKAFHQAGQPALPLVGLRGERKPGPC
ncbi:MAG: hypothetical protein ABIO73_14320 [Polaromonas sp.]